MSNSILLVGNFLSASAGNRSVCEDLASRLGSAGWTVWTTSPRPQRLNRLLDMLGTAWVRRNHYSVAHVDVYSGPAYLWAEAVCWILRRAGQPYVLTLRGGNLPRFSRQWKRRVCHLLRSAVTVTTPSAYLKNAMQPFRSDLYLLPNALDVGAYPFKRREKMLPHLVWLRAFHQIYNPVLAVKVLALLSRQFPGVRLTMVGPDKRDGSLAATREIAESLGVFDRITWSGGVAKRDVPKSLNSGDIFLNTSNIDNTPVSVLEAMACGLCVTSTNVGGLPYLLEHESDALLVSPDDPEVLTQAVTRILTDPNLARRLSLNARQKAEQFDWSVVLPQWEKLLTRVMELRSS